MIYQTPSSYTVPITGKLTIPYPVPRDGNPVPREKNPVPRDENPVPRDKILIPRDEILISRYWIPTYGIETLNKFKKL